MNVLVDTSVWLLALRRRRSTSPRDEGARAELAELIHEGRALLAGPIRQEVLSGLSDPRVFSPLRDHLRAFDDVALDSADYERAAEFSSTCRRAGIQGSHVDFLICAAAARHGASVFTLATDFAGYAAHIPLLLHQPRRR